MFASKYGQVSVPLCHVLFSLSPAAMRTSWCHFPIIILLKGMRNSLNCFTLQYTAIQSQSVSFHCNSMEINKQFSYIRKHKHASPQLGAGRRCGGWRAVDLADY